MNHEGDLPNLRSIQFGKHAFIYYTSAIFKGRDWMGLITTDLPKLQSLVLEESALSGSSFNKNSSFPLFMMNSLEMKSTFGKWDERKTFLLCLCFKEKLTTSSPRVWSL